MADGVPQRKCTVDCSIFPTAADWAGSRALTTETSVSDSVCTDRFGVPFSLTAGVFTAALSYVKLTRRR